MLCLYFRFQEFVKEIGFHFSWRFDNTLDVFMLYMLQYTMFRYVMHVFHGESACVVVLFIWLFSPYV